MAAGRLPLNYPIGQIVPAMRKMCRALECDICEMAFTTYVCARAYGKPFTAIPVFVTRNFHHWAMFLQREVRHPDTKDLRPWVRVNCGYTVTTGLWARGILQSEYGVDLNKITWIPTDDEHVAEFKGPPTSATGSRASRCAICCCSGEIDAALGEVGSRGAGNQAADPGRQERGVRLFPAAPASIRSITALWWRIRCSRKTPGSSTS